MNPLEMVNELIEKRRICQRILLSLLSLLGEFQ